MKPKITRSKRVRQSLAYDLSKGDQCRILAGVGQTPEALARDLETCQQKRPDIARPFWRVSLSAHPDDGRLDDDKWRDIADAFLAKMGLEGRPYVMVKHDDRPHDHIHITLCRIGLDGSVWHGRWDVMQAIEVCQQIEKQFGLTLTPGLDPDSGRKGLTPGEYWRADRTDEDPVRARLQALVDEALTGNPSAPEFVKKLEASGISVKPNLASTGRLNGFSFGMDGVMFKGSQLGKAYTMKGLTSRGLSYDPERDAEELRKMTKDSGISVPDAPESPQVHDVTPGHGVGLTESEETPPASNRMFFLVRSLGDVETLKASGWHPAGVVMTPGRKIGVELRFDRPLKDGEKARILADIGKCAPGALEVSRKPEGIPIESREIVLKASLGLER